MFTVILVTYKLDYKILNSLLNFINKKYKFSLLNPF